MLAEVIRLCMPPFFYLLSVKKKMLVATFFKEDANRFQIYSGLFIQMDISIYAIDFVSECCP